MNRGRMTPEEYKHGPDHFWMQFTCGAVLGALLGAVLARHFAEGFLAGVVIFLSCGGGLALAAGFWGDKFWDVLIRIFGRW